MGYKKICLSCRKAFNQSAKAEVQSGTTCPECGLKMTEVDHKFRPPRKTDVKSWNLVKFLVENGFLFQHVYKIFEKRNGLVLKEKYAAYPTNMREAKIFVAKFKDQAIAKRE